MTPYCGWETNAINILPKISRMRISGNEIWSFKIRYHKKHVSWKIIDKMWWRNYSQTLWEKFKSLKIYKVCFYCMLIWGLLEYIEIKLQSKISYKAISTHKNGLGTSLFASFSAWLLKKNIRLFIFYYFTKLYCLVAFTLWDIGQYVY